METHVKPIQPATERLTSSENRVIDPEKLRAFTAGAKYRTSDDRMPWSRFDQDAVARYNVSLRLNDYYLSMLRYISKQHGISQQKFMANIILPALENEWNNLKGGGSS